MVRFIFVLFCALSLTCSLKVMTFNVWMAGKKVNYGLQKIANQVKIVNPDVVILQESGSDKDIAYIYKMLIEYLGSEWSGAADCEGDKGLITRHKILNVFERVQFGMNARIQLKNSGLEISIWSMHLEYRMYGPDQAFFGDATIDKILRGEKETKDINGRILNIVELLKHPMFVQQIKNSDNVPVIVAGDFNVPSHLDWTESTKDRHNNWTVDWPVTKLLSETAGMIDSYREVNPDPVANPGLTWTVYKKYEQKTAVKDRIDFIFYRGSLKATKSYTYNGVSPIIDDWETKYKNGEYLNNEWPSDHWAVITEFEAKTRNYYPQPAWNSFYIDPQFNKETAAQVKNCDALVFP